MLPNPSTIRERRKKRFEVAEDAQQHLWAISYSDMLMLLVSFFVIYFQVSDDKQDKLKESPLSKIILALKERGGTVQEIKPGNPEAKGSLPSSVTEAMPSQTGIITDTAAPAVGTKSDPKKKTFANVAELLRRQNSRLKVDANAKTGGLMVDFPEDIYGVGEFAPKERLVKDISGVLGVLHQYRGEITLVFIGHTDTMPVRKLDHRLVDSNLVLSNLRGSRAAEIALQKGFDPKWVSAQGVGEHARKSRSLSISISEREPEVRP